MAKMLLLVRHCRAEGQHPTAPLTAGGRTQAMVLADFLANRPVERIVSSPYVRAVESIRPLAHRLGIKVETDERLRERLLSQGPLPDPLERLQESFDDLDMRLAGGESSREAMARGVSAIEDLRRHVANVTVVVTHGNLLTLLLKHFDDRFGFEEWRRLTNPDIFCVTIAEDGARVERIWGA